MGVKSFSHELKVKVSASRFFKALVNEAHNVLPKASKSIKSVEVPQGSAIAPGCVYTTNFAEGPFKYIKNRFDVIDHDNYVCKFTTVEGDGFGDKVEKICHEVKLAATPDGGCVVTLSSEFHTKGSYEPSEAELEGGKAQAQGMYKEIEEYLLANPNVCA